jgi:hypothetical protein
MPNRYDPHAEPVVDAIADRRPCYVRQAVLDALVASGDWLSVWRLGSTVSTVETKGHAMVRPRECWGADLGAAIIWWSDRRMRAPSSPAGMIRDAAPLWYVPTRWSGHGWALQELVGGWQEAKVRGTILGPHRLYDLRRAYRWALTAAPLPDRQSLTIAKEWRPERPGLHVVELEPWAGAPWPLRDGGRHLIETPTDIAHYGPPAITAYLGGIYWHRTIPTDGLAEVIDSTGVAACARTYWGTWVAQTPVERTYQTGTVTQLRPRGTDAVRGHLILQRVRRRMAEVQADYRYVDSVMTKGELAVGERPGDWRLVREYPDGVWIGWPGAYGPPNAVPDRAAGVPDLGKFWAYKGKQRA